MVPVLLLFALGAPAAAATLTVDPSGATSESHATISDAVDAAAPGDTIEVMAGRYDESVTIERDLTVIGVSGPASTSVSGDLPFTITAGTVEIRGFELRATGVRAAHVGGGTVTFSDMDVSDVMASALYIESGATVTVSDSTFDANGARRAVGGHIHCDMCSLTVHRSSFSNGEAQIGGAIYVREGTLAVSEGTFTDNRAYDGYTDSQMNVPAYGGAIAARSSDVDIQDSTFIGNSCGIAMEGDGGGIALLDGGTLSVVSSEFVGNISEQSFRGRAAIFAETTTVIIDASTFAGNVGIAVTARAARVTDSTFSGNEAGGLYVMEGTVTASTFEGFNHLGSAVSGTTLDIDGCSFDGHSWVDPAIYASGSLALSDSTFTRNAGGAVHVTSTGSLQATRNRFCGNSGGYGGAVYLEGPGTLFNNVFIENRGGSFDSGSAIGSAGTSVLVVNNTFLGSYSWSPGCGALAGGLFELTNNVVAWTTDGYGACTPWTARGPYDYNLWYANADGDTFGGAEPGSHDVTGVDPLLAAYTGDGDCGNDYVWPAGASSPLVDAGHPFLTDPDGTRSDIGAYGGPYADPIAFVDADGDGWSALADCDDDDPATHPAATEVRYDGIDQDCDGADLADVDGDGHVGLPAGGDDCDDEDAAIYPGAAEIAGDGIDQDCDGSDPSSDGIDSDSDSSDPGSDGIDSGRRGCGCDGGPGLGMAGWGGLFGVLAASVFVRRLAAAELRSRRS